MDTGIHTPNTHHSSSLLGHFRELPDHLNLIRKMIIREIQSRYKGSMLGMLWSVLNPLIMLAVYTFVFSFVFKARWNTGSDSRTEFALALFLGMIIHGCLAECINRAPTLITNNPSYVKKVVFPLDSLAWITLGSILFHVVINLTVWLSFFALVNLKLHLTLLWVPILLLPLILISVGTLWFFSALGVYLRDTSQFTGVLSTLLLFLSPVFYPISALPEKFQLAMYANPLTPIIEQFRQVMMWGYSPDIPLLLLMVVLSTAYAQLCFMFFNKTRDGFADVI